MSSHVKYLLKPFFCIIRLIFAFKFNNEILSLFFAILLSTHAPKIESRFADINETFVKSNNMRLLSFKLIILYKSIKDSYDLISF